MTETDKENEAPPEIHPITEEDILQQARRDAQHNLPAAGQKELSQFEKQLLCLHERELSVIAQNYLTQLEEVEAKILKISGSAEKRRAEKRSRSEAVYAAKRLALKESNNLDYLRQEVGELEREFERLKAEVDRLPTRYFSGKVYHSFQGLIFVGLILLNSCIFNFWPAADWRTWVLALVIAAASVQLAHFAGARLREREVEGGTFFGGVATFVVALVLYGVLVYYRSEVLVRTNHNAPLTMLIEGNILFFWQNFSLFAGLALLSFLYADPQPGYSRSFSKRNLARKQLRLAERRFHTALEKLELNKLSRDDGAEKAYRAEQAELVDLKRTYDSVLREGQERECRCALQLVRDISLYRRENLIARKEKCQPLSFAEAPEIELRMANKSMKLELRLD